MKNKILFITGSLNQTSQMHQICRFLPEFDCWFSQVFSDTKSSEFLLKRTTLLNKTVMAGQFRENTERYLRQHGLQIDYKALKNKYDLVVFCSDMVVPPRLRDAKTVWVQEGMIDRLNFAAHVVKTFSLPIWMAGNTSLNGSTNLCDVYCAASDGYREALIKMGAQRKRIVVTGMPNYDNLQRFANNDFPYRDYVMVATSDMRETFRFENRPAFIKEAVKIANGRRLLFKLHPNEDFPRAQREIKKYAPHGTLLFQSGNTNEMIANCCELITQYSTVVYTGIALGKKVHSWFDTNELYKLMPVQNNGTSAENIANVCRAYLAFKGPGASFLREYDYQPVPSERQAEELVAV
ncbi:MAG TPA: hypothetical protein VIM55_12615 [Mucilaginibacter sp.]